MPMMRDDIIDGGPRYGPPYPPAFGAPRPAPPGSRTSPAEARAAPSACRCRLPSSRAPLPGAPGTPRARSDRAACDTPRSPAQMSPRCAPAPPRAPPDGSPGDARAPGHRTAAAARRYRPRACAAVRTLRSNPSSARPPKTPTGPSNGPGAFQTPPHSPRSGAERGAAPTGRLRLRVDEGKAARQPLRDVVESRAVQIDVALLVDHDLHAVDVEFLVMRPLLGVELQQVRHAGAAAALHTHAQECRLRQVPRLLELLHLLRRRF